VRSRILPIVLLCAGSCAPQAPGPGMLLLSNPDFPLINVEAVITANPDCDARDDGYISTLEFTMPNNATKFIDVPPGADVLAQRSEPRPAVSGQMVEMGSSLCCSGKDDQREPVASDRSRSRRRLPHRARLNRIVTETSMRDCVMLAGNGGSTALRIISSIDESRSG
jgi:hypothetical protein